MAISFSGEHSPLHRHLRWDLLMWLLDNETLGIGLTSTTKEPSFTSTGLVNEGVINWPSHVSEPCLPWVEATRRHFSVYGALHEAWVVESKNKRRVVESENVGR